MKSALILFAMLMWSAPVTQDANIFTYPTLDAHLISLWVHAENGTANQLPKAYSEVQESWKLIKTHLLTENWKHLDMAAFVTDQDRILTEMHNVILDGKLQKLSLLSFEILQNFREVRTYFTSDLYPLDELLLSFLKYDEIHQAVDDPMLGLYEWKDFVQLFTDFKRQFKRYVVLAEPAFSGEEHVLFKLSVQRVIDCSHEFEKAIETAQQSNFVAPCDDTRDAMLELIALYQHPRSNL